MKLAAAALALGLAAAACGGAPRVNLNAGWPATALPYEEAYDRWTRHARAHHDVDLAIDAWATLKSAEWRAAFVAHKTKTALLSPEASTALAAKERQAAEEVWEVELVVATHEYHWMDFGRGQKSMWKLWLGTDDGREVAPLKVVEDRRPRGEIHAWFTELGPFHRAFIVTFPRTLPDGTPLVTESTRELHLRIGSAIAGVKLRWRR